MVDSKHKPCITCKLKQPYLNYPNEKQPPYCNACKKCGMIDVTNSRCISCNLKQPNFNSPNEKIY